MSRKPYMLDSDSTAEGLAEWKPLDEKPPVSDEATAFLWGLFLGTLFSLLLWAALGLLGYIVWMLT